MAEQLHVVFMGTPDFAAVILRYLAQNPNTAIQTVVTQPDRPKGRGRKAVSSPVKSVAEEAGFPLWQPPSLRTPESQDILRSLSPDLLVVAAYGLLLPPEILSIPAIESLNVHASLLPKYRGAAPIQRALGGGELVTGISIMAMRPGLDSGPLALQRAIPIGLLDTAATLHDKLAHLGGHCLLDALDKMHNHQIVYVPQDENQATYAPKLSKDEGKVNWRQPAHMVHNHIRSVHPWPGAFTHLQSPLGDKTHKVQIYPGQVGSPLPSHRPPGMLEAGPDDTLRIACLDRYYIIDTVKPASRRPMSTSAFMCGYLTSGHGQDRFG